MAMTVNPNTGTKALDSLHEQGLYRSILDVNDDAAAVPPLRIDQT